MCMESILNCCSQSTWQCYVSLAALPVGYAADFPMLGALWGMSSEVETEAMISQLQSMYLLQGCAQIGWGLHSLQAEFVKQKAKEVYWYGRVQDRLATYLSQKEVFIKIKEKDEFSLVPLWNEVGDSQAVLSIWTSNRHNWDKEFAVRLLRFFAIFGHHGYAITVCTEILEQCPWSASARLLSGICSLGVLSSSPYCCEPRLMFFVDTVLRQIGKGTTQQDIFCATVLLWRGVAERWKGRYKEAKRSIQAVVNFCKCVFGMDHRQTMASMAELAQVSRQMGQYDEARQLLKQVLQWRIQNLGEQDTETLWSMHYLAVVYMRMGQFNKAEELLRDVVESREEKLGRYHFDTLAALANLAAVFRQKGKVQAAMDLCIEVHQQRERKWGVKHPQTFNAMENLALTLMQKGEHAKALALQLDVLHGREKHPDLGGSHIHTFAAMHNLGLTLYEIGNLREAEEMLEGALKGRISKMGLKHPYTVRTKEKLAMVRRRLSVNGE